MNAQSLALHELKQQVYALVEQLSREQLLALEHTLHEWLLSSHSYTPNGATTNGVAIQNNATEQEQPWRKYTAELKTSPDWDEFLEVLAELHKDAPAA